MQSSGFQMKSLIEYIKKQPTGPSLEIVVPKSPQKKQKGKPKTPVKSTLQEKVPGKKGNPYRKQKISQALREQVWIQHNGRVFQAKCMVTWCKNKITVFDFQCGHDIPESKGGPTNISNLYPICGKCNLSMSNTYTFQEWCKLYEAIEEPTVDPLPSPSPPPAPPLKKKPSFWKRMFSCFKQ